MPPKNPKGPKTQPIPIYNVPEIGSNPNLPIVPDPPPVVLEKTVVRPAKNRAKVIGLLAVRTAKVIIPAVLAGLGSYNSSKGDSDAGYKTMAAAVKELQDANKELVKQISAMQADLDASRDAETRAHGFRPLLPTKSKPIKSVEFTALPADLGSAIQEQKKMDPYLKREIHDRAVAEMEMAKRATAIQEMQKEQEIQGAKAGEALKE